MSPPWPEQVLRKVLQVNKGLYISIPKALAAATGITRGEVLLIRASGRRGFEAHRLTEATTENPPRRIRARQPDSPVAPSGPQEL